MDKERFVAASKSGVPTWLENKHMGMSKTRSAKHLVTSKSNEALSPQQPTLEMNFQQRRNLLKVQKMKNTHELEVSHKELKFDSMFEKINNVSEGKGKLSVFYKNAPTKNSSK